MKKKIALIIGVILFGVAIWYLFIKPYDYIVSLKANTSPGTINQSIKLWSDNLGSNSTVNQLNLNELKQQVTIDSTLYHLYWKIRKHNDSVSKISVHIKEPNERFRNKILIPFSKTKIENDSKKALLEFNNSLLEHLKNFKVNIIGKENIPASYCAYVAIKAIQIQKAKGMMNNYMLLSNFIASNNLKPKGNPMIEVTNWDIKNDSLHYNFCFPIIKPDSLPLHNKIQYKEFKNRTAIKAIYKGNYITSDRAWYALMDYAAKKNIDVTLLPFEIFHNNPNMGGNELRWKTEVFLPIN